MSALELVLRNLAAWSLQVGLLALAAAALSRLVPIDRPATPLALGSLWCAVPAGIAVVAILLRTAFEDRMLRAQLDGYEDYARRVRWKDPAGHLVTGALQAGRAGCLAPPARQG